MHVHRPERLVQENASVPIRVSRTEGPGGADKIPAGSYRLTRSQPLTCDLLGWGTTRPPELPPALGRTWRNSPHKNPTRGRKKGAQRHSLLSIKMPWSEARWRRNRRSGQTIARFQSSNPKVGGSNPSGRAKMTAGAEFPCKGRDPGPRPPITSPLFSPWRIPLRTSIRTPVRRRGHHPAPTRHDRAR